MKKFLMVICATLIIFSQAAAQIPDYLNGDRNFLLSGMHAGTAWHIDKNSVKILTVRYDFYNG